MEGSKYSKCRSMSRPIHMLVEIPPKISVSSFMGLLKGKSSLMIYERWGNMRFKLGR